MYKGEKWVERIPLAINTAEIKKGDLVLIEAVVDDVDTNGNEIWVEVLDCDDVGSSAGMELTRVQAWIPTERPRCYSLFMLDPLQVMVQCQKDASHLKAASLSLLRHEWVLGDQCRYWTDDEAAGRLE